MKIPFSLLGLFLAAHPALHAQGMGKQEMPSGIEPEITSLNLASSLSRTKLGALIQDRRWDAAVILAEEATRRQPHSAPAWYELGIVRFNQHQYTKAVRALRRSEQLAPNDADVHRFLGLSYYLLEQYHLFEQQMQRGRDAQPQNGEFDYLLGRYYHLIVGDCTQAIVAFDRAISLRFASAKVLYNRGDCYDQAGDLTRAERDFVSAIDQIRSTRKADTWPFQALARLYMRTGRSKEALPLAREAVRLDAGSEANHLLLGKVLAQEGDTSAAIVELRKAVQLSPAAEGTRYQLYRLYLRLGDRESAERELAAFREILATNGKMGNPR